MSEDEKKVWEVIQALNVSWTTATDVDDLGPYFHEDAVALVGADRRRISGREACAAHWKKCSENQIQSWKEIDPKVRIFDGQFATVSYAFDITLDRGDGVRKASSSDSFALVKDGDRWVIALATV